MVKLYKKHNREACISVSVLTDKSSVQKNVSVLTDKSSVLL